VLVGSGRLLICQRRFDRQAVDIAVMSSLFSSRRMQSVDGMSRRVAWSVSVFEKYAFNAFIFQITETVF